MSLKHLTDGLITRVLAERHCADDVRSLVRHILETCEQCRAKIRASARIEGWELTPALELELPPEPADRAEAATYEAVFDRVVAAIPPVERRLAEEKLRAGALWSRLRPLAHARRVSLVAADPAFHRLAVLTRLLSECALLRSRPREYREVAALAVLVASRLDRQMYGAGQIADLHARALGELANAARLGMDFRGAALALREAFALLDGGTGDALERARLWSFEGSLHVDLGRFEHGIACFERCFALYDSMSDRHMMGRALVKQAHAVGQLDPAAAVALLRRALGLIESEEEPLLALAARHNLGIVLCDAGRPEEALATLESARSLYEQFQEPKHLLRMAWLEAKILFGLGLHEDAAFAFDAVRGAFLADHLEQEFVLASIDFAEALLALGETARAVAILAQVHAWLEGWGMHSEGLGVLLLVKEAIEREQVAAAHLRQLAMYLKRAWIQPVAGEDEHGLWSESL
jgi:tetratricopeptide (TPR) repeat protein